MRSLTRFLFAVLVAASVLAGCNRPAEQEAHRDPPPTEAAHPSEGHDEHAGHAGEADEHGAHEGEHQEGVVTLSPDAQKQAKIAVVPVQPQLVADAFATTGEFEANADRLAHVKPAVPGRVTSVLKTVGDRVRAGETLAILQSSELGDAQAAYLEALSRLALAREGVERQRKLFAEDLTARKDVAAAESDLRLARIDQERSRHRLRTLGLSTERLALLERHQRIDSSLPLVAPLRGVITERHLTLGETVEAGGAESAFVIVDTQELWVNANLYEKDLARVQVGQVAEVTTPAYPGRAFRGRVSLISPVLDPETRTAQARIVVANPEGLLKPEMFANAFFRIGARRALAVPARAVMQDKGETYVFVQKGETSFEKRNVALGPVHSALVPVTSGLQEGERVVSDGAFTLKAELLKESFGEHEH